MNFTAPLQVATNGAGTRLAPVVAQLTTAGYPRHPKVCTFSGIGRTPLPAMCPTSVAERHYAVATARIYSVEKQSDGGAFAADDLIYKE